MHTATSGHELTGQLPAPARRLPEWAPQLPISGFTRHRLRFARRRLEDEIEPVAGERGHADRVAILAQEVAARIGFDGPELAYDAGRLHDVGKAALAFDPTVVPRALTPEERAEVELHPELGALLVRDAGYPDEVVQAVLLHHERIDGSGYPYGLSGSAVPLLAQVVAAVDVFDALATARSYKDPWCRASIERFGEFQCDRWFRSEVWDALLAATA